uniref:Uncharacterized protein n=1 Tax=Caenorhabditis japonica TaxID=281687 RepID=A0A8R1DH29_CAEJA
MCKRETTKTEPELPKEIRSTMAPLNREGPPKKASVSLMVENTQPSTRNTSKLTEISVQSPEKQVLDQEQGIDKSGNLSSSELEVMNTQDDTSEKLPIPKKPESRKLSNGRMQKTSMNYEESTYSDLT